MRVPIRLLFQELGVRALAHYSLYQFQLRSGVVRRRTPPYAWADRPLTWWVGPGRDQDRGARRSPFAVSPDALERLRRIQGDSRLPATRAADEILGGRFRLFGGEPVALGFPPDWLRLPFDGAEAPLAADRHWSSYLGDTESDFRLLWELSRFGWAYALGRGYLLSGERRYADGFFTLLHSWRRANPPNRGPHWISAQESALRVMALSFAWIAFADLLHGAPERQEPLLTTIAACAYRIPPTLAYAQAQRNNHLISEAVGLYTAGLLFPQFRAAPRWKAAGRRLLVGALEDQVSADGGYIQHSTNYHRLALSAGLWMARWAEAYGEPLPDRSLAALRRMTEALAALVDPLSGRVPNLGSNDGSDVLPLGGSPLADYRPVLQAASLACDRRPALDPGPWDELALWLGLDLDGGQGSGGRRRPATDFPQAGLYLVRGERSWAALRSARFTVRPSQSDQLHLDLWWEGLNIARDPGSYRYTVSGLEGAAAHNTLTADGKEPMQRLGRFLWVARQPARYLARWAAEDVSAEAIAAEQGLPTGLTHRRSLIRAGQRLWVVLDELAGDGEHAARLSWLLPDAAWELQGGELRLQLEPGSLTLRIEPAQAAVSLYRAGRQLAGEPAPEPESTVGWWSPSYGHREPALTLVARLRDRLPLRLTSWWRLGEWEADDYLSDQALERLLGGGE